MEPTLQTHWSIWIFGFLLPPLLAMFYSLSVLTMYISFHEWTMAEKWTALAWRFGLLTGAAALTYSERYTNVHGSDISDLGRICMLAVQAALIWTLSYYFLMETRLFDVVGGRDPSLKLLEDNDKIPMKDKIVLITGSNAGIGKETARQLAALGATKIILACRSPKRGQQAMEELRKLQTKKKMKQYLVLECDLGDFDSVRKAVDWLKNRQSEDIPQIDLLILNAGVMMSERVETKNGLETMMQANLLGHFLLTRLLMEKNLIKPNKKKPPRVLHLTSSTHQIAISSHGSLDLEDLMCDKGKRQYSLFGQYGQTKLANILFAKELARRYKNSLVSLAVHPGIVRTDVTRNMPAWLRWANDLFSLYVASMQKNVEQGAWCSVTGSTIGVDLSKTSTHEGDATNDGEKEGTPKNESGIPNGSYLQNGKVRQTHPYTYNEADASKFWDISEKLVGLEQK